MNNLHFVEDLLNLFNQFKQSLFAFLPNVIASLLIFLIGLILARLVKTLSERFISRVDSLIPHKKVRSKVNHFITEKPVARVIGSVLFWTIVFFFLTAATEALGLPVMTAWLSGVADYLPRILAGVLIGIIGIIGSIVIRDIIFTTTASTGIIHGETLGKLVQTTIILLSVIIGIEQIGFDITLLTSLITIVVGAFLFGAALAFGLGAKTTVSNILASYYLQKNYQVGHTVKIGDKEGRIVRITPVAIVLDSTEGQIYIPAKDFSTTASTIINKEG